MDKKIQHRKCKSKTELIIKNRLSKDLGDINENIDACIILLEIFVKDLEGTNDQVNILAINSDITLIEDNLLKYRNKKNKIEQELRKLK
ncbi:hypothetical protein J4H41_17850 [Vibrio alginolyticus]|uniref:hypothetical protein n=1 Tax=Vibrio alginolyticus TaxID=663 RepID=UPI001BD3DB51|nr:hypothetical protein [Vibrio alginolyticus]MBS9898125.1 hypothetical protein [Vibrio alginolyticus]